MKIAVIGSRSLSVNNLDEIIPEECTEIVSGGARGVDSSASAFAEERGLILTEFLPDYDQYGKGAPLVRNRQIVEYADAVYAFWDGGSRGTKYTIDYARKLGKPVRIFGPKKSE